MRLGCVRHPPRHLNQGAPGDKQCSSHDELCHGEQGGEIVTDTSKGAGGTQATVSVHLSVLSTIPEFFESEDLGVHPPKLCGSCRKCPDCKFRNSSLSRDEAEVVSKQESLMMLNETEHKFEVQYAWNQNVNKLKDNQGQAVSFQKSVEKKLLKQGELSAYNAELQKNIDKGYLVKLGEEDLLKYMGPVSYVSHHPVYKASKTTPIRPVTNTSLKNKTCDLSPNDCMGEPPNALSSLLNVFLRWRTYTVALNLDLTKAYQSISTGQVERNVR